MLSSKAKPAFHNLAFPVYRKFGRRLFSLSELKRTVFSEKLALASIFCTTGLALGLVTGSENAMQFTGRFIPPPERRKNKKPEGQLNVDCFKPEKPRPRGAAAKQVAAKTPSVDDELLRNIMWSALLAFGGERIRPSAILACLRRAYERFEVPPDAALATTGDVQRALKQFVAEAKLTRHAPGVSSSELSYGWVLERVESGWMKDLATVQVPTNSHSGCEWIARQTARDGTFSIESLKARARKELAQKPSDCPFSQLVMIDFIVEECLRKQKVIEKVRGKKKGSYKWVFKPQPPL